jgi:hypothetical protein
MTAWKITLKRHPDYASLTLDKREHNVSWKSEDEVGGNGWARLRVVPEGHDGAVRITAIEVYHGLPGKRGSERAASFVLDRAAAIALRKYLNATLKGATACHRG